jgi:transposase
MDLKTRIEIVECFYASNRSSTAALRLFKSRRQLHKDLFTITTITNLIDKFEETGSVMDKPHSGRPSFDESTCDTVAHTVQELTSTSCLGSTSVRQVAVEVGISKSSVHNLLRKRLRLYPYRLQLLQTLEPADKPQRLQFAHWLLNNQNILSDILWSDEAYFTLDGVINTHNCRIWSDCKPDTVLTKSLHSPQLCVWMGLSARYGLEPFFFEGTVNADRYLQMLQQHVRPQLARKRKLSSCIFMQDGAPLILPAKSETTYSTLLDRIE